MKRNRFLIGMTSVLLAFGMIGCAQSTGGGVKEDGEDGKEIVSYTSGSYKLFINEILAANALELSANIYGGAAYSISDLKTDVQYNYRLYGSNVLISSGTVKKTAENLLQFKVRATGKTFNASISGTSLSLTVVEKDDGGSVVINGTFTPPSTGSDTEPGGDNDSSGPSGGGKENVITYAIVKNETDFNDFIKSTSHTTAYVDGTFEISSPLIIPSGRTLMASLSGASANTLALPNTGALFATSTTIPSSGKIVIKSNGGLTLGTGALLVLGSVISSSAKGELKVEAGGKLLVAKGASITATTSSQIQLAATTSTLVFEDDTAKLNVVGSLGTSKTVVGNDPAKAPVVLLSVGTADLTIGKGNVAEPTKLGNDTGYTGSSKLASVTTSADAHTKLVSGSTVVYSGTAAGTDSTNNIVIPTGATLIISNGTVDQKNFTITGTGKLVVAATGKVITNAGLPESAANLKNDGVIETTYSSLGATGLAALVGADGSGTIVLKAAVTGVTSPLTLNQNLEIDTGGNIEYTTGDTNAFTVSTAKKLTIRSTGKLTLGNDVIGLASGNNLTVANGGGGYAAISTGNKNALNDILAAVTGYVTVTGTDTEILSGTKVRNGTTLTIANGTDNAKLKVPTELTNWTFTVENGAKVVVASEGTLDLSALTATGAVKLDGTIEVANGGTLNLFGIPATAVGAVTISGTIEVSGELKAPVTDNGKTPQIKYTGNGAIKLKNGSKASIGGMSYIGSEALYTWDGTQTGITDPHILLKQDDMTLNANLSTLANNSINDTATISKGATLTIGDSLLLAIDVAGTVNVYGTLKLLGATTELSSRVTLAGDNSKLVVHPQGTIDATTAANSLIHGSDGRDEDTVKVTVSATNGGTATRATAVDGKASSETQPKWTLTSTSAATPLAINIVIGRFKLAVAANTAVSAAPGATANTDGAVASLTAGTGTYITFAGTTEAPTGLSAPAPVTEDPVEPAAEDAEEPVAGEEPAE